MATTEINFDDLLSDADEAYGDYVIVHPTAGRVVLRGLLRLSQAERDELQDALTDPTPDPKATPEEQRATRRDPEETFRTFIRLVAEDKDVADAFLKAFPKNRTDALKLIQERWFEKTQAGEAKPSSN